MRSIASVSLIAGVGLIALARELKSADEQKNAREKDLAAFVGTWEIIATQPEGITKEAWKLVFRRDMTYFALDKNGKELWAGTFDLNPTASPKIWDHRSNDSKKAGGDVLGIYELEGDKLKVACVVGTWKNNLWMGQPRPTEFKRPAADVILEFRRVKADRP